MQRPVRPAIAAMLLALLGACAAPAPLADAGATPDAPAAPGAVDAPRRPAKPPGMSDPQPAQRLPGTVAAADRSCRADADCAVKDVGSCCGYQPACVNKDSPTDPAAVRAQCEASGMASVCGFRRITACTCNAGRCEAAGADAPVVR